ncbi:MAG: protein-glutamate O-methyltransferase [Nitrospirae bacterium]|nr:protein-glutamate O-methyltransferase [Nitrospirota bacterium]
MPDSLCQMTDGEFAGLSRLIHVKTGIYLPSHKRALLMARLSGRLRFHGFRSFRDYLAYLTEQDCDGRELIEMINCVTTNQTEFFREGHHFDFLAETVFPGCLRRVREGGEPKVRIWSAGCSTGEEPYSIAMTMMEYFGGLSGWDVQILASDLDTLVLETAGLGIYPPGRIGATPEDLRKKYLLPIPVGNRTVFRVDDRIRDLVTFRRINLLESPWPIREVFDVIFCRNVMIYFTQETITEIVMKFIGFLRPGGFLLIGHAETLFHVTDRLRPIRATVYQRIDGSPPLNVVPPLN